MISFRLDIMQHYISQGNEIILLTPLDEKAINRLPKVIKFIAIDFERTSKNPLNDLKLFKQIRDILQKEKPHYVFTYTIKPNIYGTLAAKSCGIHSTMMMAGLGYTFTNNHISSLIARNLYRFALSFSDFLFLLNKENVNRIMHYKMCNNDKIIFLSGGEGVNLRKYEFSDNASETVSFIFIGRLIKEKGIHDFCKAANIVKLNHSNVSFFIAGELDTLYPGSLTEEELKQYTNSGNVEFLGRVNISEFMKRKGLVVTIPSYYSEGLNRSLMEGCACGKPILTTNHPGCKETVKNGFNGYIVEKQNPQDLANKMIQYINLSQDEKNRMSHNSRKLAEQFFDIHNVIDHYDRIIKSV